MLAQTRFECARRMGGGGGKSGKMGLALDEELVYLKLAQVIYIAYLSGALCELAHDTTRHDIIIIMLQRIKVKKNIKNVKKRGEDTVIRRTTSSKEIRK